MPPPRPRKLLARKSLATDPSLYLTPLDSDDDDAVPPLPPSAPPVAYPASGTKRRSARLSVEGTGNDSPAPLHHNKRSTTSTSRAKTPKSPAVPKSVKKDTGGKAKGRGRGEESEEEVIEETREEVDDVVEIQGRAPRGSNKRSKTGDKGGEGSAGTDTRLLPRAAMALNASKPQPSYTQMSVDDSSDNSGFAFTTHPPTPHANRKDNLGTSKMAGTSKRATVDGVTNPRLPKSARTAAHSTSRNSITPPPRSYVDGQAAPITTAETPKLLSNIAFRAGGGPSTPGTSRRASVDRRGKRGSSIGGGFEALPHDEVQDDRLYRSTDAGAPVALRLRALLSWTSQRVRNREFPLSSAGDEWVNEGGDETRAMAKELIDEFIVDVCQSKVDVSTSRNLAKNGKSKKALPPHPQNVANASKLAEVEENWAAIAKEESERQTVLGKYTALEEVRSRPTPGPSTLPVPIVESFTLDSSLSHPESYDQVLSLGRHLLSIDPSAVVKPSKGKGKGKGKEVEPMDELSSTLSAVRIRSANLQQITHRLTSFSTLASTYISTRLSQSHSSLLIDSRRGMSAMPAPGGGEVGITELVRGLEGDVGGSNGRNDARALLRAISAADVRSRTG